MRTAKCEACTGDKAPSYVLIEVVISGSARDSDSLLAAVLKEILFFASRLVNLMEARQPQPRAAAHRVKCSLRSQSAPRFRQSWHGRTIEPPYSPRPPAPPIHALRQAASQSRVTSAPRSPAPRHPRGS